MTNATDKKTGGFMFPMPVDGRGDNEVALHQECNDPNPSPVAGLPLSTTAYDYWRTAVEKGGMTPEACVEITKAFEEIRTFAIDRMQQVPVPEGVLGTIHEATSPESKETPVYIPYLLNAGFSLLTTVIAQVFPKHTVPERFAILAELVRAYAASGIGAYTQHGVTPAIPQEKVVTLAALRTVAQPAPLRIVAEVVQEQRKIREEADLRGVSTDQVYAERLKAMAGTERLAGEPADD
jgi:hypothetical protein